MKFIEKVFEESVETPLIWSKLTRFQMEEIKWSVWDTGKRLDPLQNLNYNNKAWEYEAFVINPRANNKFKMDMIFWANNNLKVNHHTN